MKIRLGESKNLKEGAGAGYEITWDSIVIDRVNSYERVSGKNRNNLVEFECDIDCTVKNVEAESYMYGTSRYDKINAKAKITRVFLNFEGFEDDEIDVDKTSFDYAVDQLIEYSDNSFMYGGGWVHSTYDGTISEIDTRKNWEQFDAKIVDKDVIDYIDKAVSGDNIFDIYEVFVDNEVWNDFSTEKEAIDYANKLLDGELAGTGSVVTIEKESEIEYFNGEVDFLDDREVIETFVADFYNMED